MIDLRKYRQANILKQDYLVLTTILPWTQVNFFLPSLWILPFQACLFRSAWGKVSTKDGHRITSLLKDQNEVQKPVQHGEATRFMQPFPRKQAYLSKTMKDLFACLRQCGLPMFFAAFSAAGMRCPEIIEAIKKQQGETVSATDLDWITKCDILRSNPLTVIRMFEKRVEALMRDLILSPAQPIGEVVDYFYRVEFQARGSAHIHCLFWIMAHLEKSKSSSLNWTKMAKHVNLIGLELDSPTAGLEHSNYASWGNDNLVWCWQSGGALYKERLGQKTISTQIIICMHIASSGDDISCGVSEEHFFLTWHGLCSSQ